MMFTWGYLKWWWRRNRPRLVTRRSMEKELEGAFRAGMNVMRSQVEAIMRDIFPDYDQSLAEHKSRIRG